MRARAMVNLCLCPPERVIPSLQAAYPAHGDGSANLFALGGSSVLHETKDCIMTRRIVLVIGFYREAAVLNEKQGWR